MLSNSNGDEPISPSPLTSLSLDKQGGATVGDELRRREGADRRGVRRRMTACNGEYGAIWHGGDNTQSTRRKAARTAARGAGSSRTARDTASRARSGYSDLLENLYSYFKTKFFRALVGIKKQDQSASRSIYEYVPLQDFSSSSDIDWSKPVSDIDSQLYSKYDLSDEEIEFIEQNIQPMD